MQNTQTCNNIYLLKNGKTYFANQISKRLFMLILIYEDKTYSEMIATKHGKCFKEINIEVYSQDSLTS